MVLPAIMTSSYMWNDIVARCHDDLINDVIPLSTVYLLCSDAFATCHTHLAHFTQCLKLFLKLYSNLSCLSLTLAYLSPKSLLQLVSVLVPSQIYALSTIPTSQSPLVVVPPSWLPLMSTMQSALSPPPTLPPLPRPPESCILSLAPL